MPFQNKSLTFGQTANVIQVIPKSPSLPFHSQYSDSIHLTVCGVMCRTEVTWSHPVAKDDGALLARFACHCNKAINERFSANRKWQCSKLLCSMVKPNLQIDTPKLLFKISRLARVNILVGAIKLDLSLFEAIKYYRSTSSNYCEKIKSGFWKESANDFPKYTEGYSPKTTSLKKSWNAWDEFSIYLK